MHDELGSLIVMVYALALLIKMTSVLPALFPGDPELDYHALEGVHNGGEAMNAFVAMEDMSPEEVVVTREQLLKYCELDTLAMVRIWQKLCESVQ